MNSLGLLQASQALEQIEACLDDQQPIVVQAAILAMARIQPERIQPRLIEFLHSDEYLIHLAATRACGWLCYEECSPDVLQALKNFMETNEEQDLKLPKLYIEVLARWMCKTPFLYWWILREGSGLRGVAVEAWWR